MTVSFTSRRNYLPHISFCVVIGYCVTNPSLLETCASINFHSGFDGNLVQVFISLIAHHLPQFGHGRRKLPWCVYKCGFINKLDVIHDESLTRKHMESADYELL